MDKQEQIIVSLIPRGAEQPISLAELSRLSGMDGRQLRSLLYRITWLPSTMFRLVACMALTAGILS